MRYRGITQKCAEWIGMAASVAGGWVAIDGPRVGRISDSDLDRQYPPQSDCDGDAVPRAYLTRHRSGRDGYVYASDPDIRAGDNLIMCLPDGADLATEGYAIPPALVAALRPSLEAAGYRVRQDT